MEIKTHFKFEGKDAEATFEIRPIGSMDRDVWAANYARWVNDPEVTEYLYQGTIPTSIEKCKTLYDTLTNDSHVVFNIMSKTSEGFYQHVGIVGVFEVYWPSRVGEFRILLGDKNYWGMGIGKAALEEMKKVAFNRLGLHKFWLGFNADHKRAEGAYTKAGFQHECVLKQHHYKNGKYHDLVRLCMFKDDYDG